MKVGILDNNYKIDFSCPSLDTLIEKTLEKTKEAGIEYGNLDELDTLIYFGCGALGKSVDQFIKEFRTVYQYSKERNFNIIVAGCITKIPAIKEWLSTASGIVVIEDDDYVSAIMNHLLNRSKPLNSIDHINNNICSNSNSSEVMLSVSIVDGCPNRCSFCKTNYMPKKIVSLPYEELLNELRKRIRNGTRVLELHGENLCVYGVDLYGRPILHKLLHELALEENLVYIQLGEVTIANMYPELLQEIVNNKKINHLNMQIETASDSQLTLMNRGYDMAKCDYVIGKLKEAGKSISTILMSGFPYETESDLDTTIAYIADRSLMVEGICQYDDSEYIPSHDLEQLSYLEKCRHTRYLTDNLRPIIDKNIAENIPNMARSVIFHKKQDYVISVGASFRFCASTKHNHLEPGDIIEEAPLRFVRKSKYFHGHSGYKF